MKSRMINPAPNPSHLNRRKALQTHASATAVGGVTAASATTTIDAFDRNAGGFGDARRVFLPALYVVWFRIKEPAPGELDRAEPSDQLHQTYNLSLLSTAIQHRSG
jgi:hypothetical protein